MNYSYKIIPVVLPDVQMGLLKRLFPVEPHYIFVDDAPTSLSDAIPPSITLMRPKSFSSLIA